MELYRKTDNYYGACSFVKHGLDSFVKHGLDSFVKHELDSFVKHGLDSFVKHGQDSFYSSVKHGLAQNILVKNRNLYLCLYITYIIYV